MLPHRRFGQCDFSVSPIGLGTVKLGRDRGLKHPGSFTIPTDAEARNLLGRAADLGINLIDTAPAYGTSEERLGALLAGWRQNWVICTKVGEEFDSAAAASRHDFSPEAVRASVERSCRRLRTDVLDIVLVHSDGSDAEIVRGGTLEALAMLRQRGLLRAFGMSSKTVAGGLLALAQSDCAMVTLNLGSREELPVIEAAAAAGKAILVKKPLASGHVGSQQAVRDAFRMILGTPGVTTAVVGTIDPAHLEANVAACAAALAPG